MLKLTIFKAILAFLGAFLPALGSGFVSSHTWQEWGSTIILAFAAGTVSLRAFVDKSVTTDPINAAREQEISDAALAKVNK